MASEAKTCKCGACYCNVGTRSATAICKRCTDGDHPGLSRGKATRIPAHNRMYGGPCEVCGAPVGRRCYKVTQDTIDGEPTKW